ncbi:hypothetical protein Bca4012_056448 [Brassica carinata]
MMDWTGHTALSIRRLGQDVPRSSYGERVGTNRARHMVSGSRRTALAIWRVRPGHPDPWVGLNINNAPPLLLTNSSRAGRTPFTSLLSKQSSVLILTNSTKNLSIAIAEKVISSLEKVETDPTVFGSGFDGKVYNKYVCSILVITQLFMQADVLYSLSLWFYESIISHYVCSDVIRLLLFCKVSSCKRVLPNVNKIRRPMMPGLLKARDDFCL